MLEKIKQFFKNIFGIKNQQYIEAPKEETVTAKNMEIEKNTNFKNQLIANEEENRVLKLQKDYKDGLIEEEDLSEEDFNTLSKLYQSQIEKTKKSIEMYKNKILSIKSKLPQNN